MAKINSKLTIILEAANENVIEIVIRGLSYSEAKEKADALIEVASFSSIDELKQAKKCKETKMSPTNVQNRYYFMIEEDLERLKHLKVIKYKKDDYSEIFYCKN